jgi:hypothetical protein
MRWIHVFPLATLLNASILGCGSEPPPKAPEPAPQAVKPHKPRMSMSSELGQIDPAETDAAFQKLQPALMGCYQDNLKRVEFLGGDVKFYLRVAQDGTAKWVFLEDATLGDRTTERCMLDLAMSAHWPTPEGGEAEVHKSLGFDPPSNVRAPADWSGDRVAATIGMHSADVAKCKAGASGAFHVTAYVAPQGKGGKVAAAGIAPPNQEGETKSDCLVDLVKKMKMPSPGSYAAKVSFTL